MIARHRPLVDAMMSAVFAPAVREFLHIAAFVPFRMQSVYATPAFERDLLGADGRLNGRVNVDERTVIAVHQLEAWALVLERVYGLQVPLDFPLVLTVLRRRARAPLQARVPPGFTERPRAW